MQTSFILKETRIPVKIRRLRSNRIKFSISKSAVNLSVPAYYSKTAIDKELSRLYRWVEDHLNSSPDLLKRFLKRSYSNGDIIIVMGHQFELKIHRESRKTIKSNLKSNQLSITLPIGLDTHEESILFSKALARFFGRYFQKEVEQKVQKLNRAHFNESINGVYLKNNKSNWGSCSSKRNINLSSRLLLAPEAVLDYVIIHELAHLKEMNHSPKFWNLVKKADPTYLEKEAWLKQNGDKLSF